MNRLTPYFDMRSSRVPRASVARDSTPRRGAVVSPVTQAMDEPCVPPRAHGAAGHFPAPPTSFESSEPRLLKIGYQLVATVIAVPLLVLFASAIIAMEIAALVLFVPGILWSRVTSGRVSGNPGHRAP